MESTASINPRNPRFTLLWCARESYDALAAPGRKATFRRITTNNPNNKMKRRIMMWLLLIPAIVVAAIIALLIFGLLQPIKHSVTRSILLKQKPEPVFAVLDKADGLPSWSSTVLRVEHIPDRNGQPATRQVMKFGMTLIVITLERQPPTRLVTSIGKDGGPVWGTWTYELTPEGEGCRVAITENGEMKNPLFRALGRLRGLDTSIRLQLTDLARKFGEEAIIY